MLSKREAQLYTKTSQCHYSGVQEQSSRIKSTQYLNA